MVIHPNMVIKGFDPSPYLSLRLKSHDSPLLDGPSCKLVYTPLQPPMNTVRYINHKPKNSTTFFRQLTLSWGPHPLVTIIRFASALQGHFFSTALARQSDANVSRSGEEQWIADPRCVRQIG